MHSAHLENTLLICDMSKKAKIGSKSDNTKCKCIFSGSGIYKQTI